MKTNAIVDRTPPRWIEYNIEAVKGHPLAELIYRVVRPARYQVPASVSWHFFREGRTIRLRFLVAQPKQALETVDAILKAEKQRSNGCVSQWWQGEHGDPTKTYNGEAAFWGKDWPLAMQMYQRGAETALSFVVSRYEAKKSEAKRSRQSLDMHAQRALHLLLNQLGYDYLSEADLHARMASGYIQVYQSIVAGPLAKGTKR